MQQINQSAGILQTISFVLVDQNDVLVEFVGLVWGSFVALLTYVYPTSPLTIITIYTYSWEISSCLSWFFPRLLWKGPQQKKP